MSETPKKFNLAEYPPHMHTDCLTRNQNIDDGKPLCEWCDGTGNELFSMYRRCPKCLGTGVADSFISTRGAQK